jgi:T5SS/PEP-CTERM-associated repeat protein
MKQALALGVVLAMAVGPALAQTVVFGGDTAPVTGSQGPSYNSGASGLTIGNTTDGTLDIKAGGSVTSGGTFSYIGNSFGSLGVVTVDGANSIWTGTSILYVGSAGDGELHITGGGKVSSGTSAANGGTSVGRLAKATGLVEVDGAGSTWTITGPNNANGTLIIGDSGEGTLNITNGGKVFSGNGTLGQKAGSTGKATVDGVGSEWSIDTEFHVGNDGIGTLDILNGGSVTSGKTTIGTNDGTGTVTVQGVAQGGVASSWTITGPLYVGCGAFYCGGDTGTGTLNIKDGGKVFTTGAGQSGIGMSPDTTGTVTVDGPNSSWTSTGQIVVGVFGSGTMTLSNGGLVEAPKVFVPVPNTPTTIWPVLVQLEFGPSTVTVPVMSGPMPIPL